MATILGLTDEMLRINVEIVRCETDIPSSLMKKALITMRPSEEIEDWLNEHCSGGWTFNEADWDPWSQPKKKKAVLPAQTLTIDNDEVALHFKLRFG